METESYWLETGLLQENMQGRFPFLNSFRWKQNLTGWRQVYGTRICQADSGSQTVFGGNRILLVGNRFKSREYAKRLTVLKQLSVESESYWLETGLSD